MTIEDYVGSLAWQILNSQFLATIATIAIAFLAKKVEKNTERAAAANEAIKFEKQAENETQEVDSIPTITSQEAARNQTTEDFRDESRSVILATKSLIDKVADAETDGRYRRTYESIGKRYPALSAALYERG